MKAVDAIFDAVGGCASGCGTDDESTDPFGEEWDEYNGHHYRLTPGIMTWTEAEAFAVNQGGHLVTINDEPEENWLKSVFGTSIEPWIGLYQPNPTPAIEPDGGWVWVSGEPVTYTNWASGEPNNAGNGLEHWAHMNFFGRWWNDQQHDPAGPSSPLKK